MRTRCRRRSDEAHTGIVPLCDRRSGMRRRSGIPLAKPVRVCVLFVRGHGGRMDPTGAVFECGERLRTLFETPVPRDFETKDRIVVPGSAW
ncbi:MAG: hypothetical protein J07HR59_00707 [Halorubrum sp. J07HR59]|nr:MAG: hypothetical protein J07HR59_00707 [Halorubrum sp. J07HR59]